MEIKEIAEIIYKLNSKEQRKLIMEITDVVEDSGYFYSSSDYDDLEKEKEKLNDKVNSYEAEVDELTEELDIKSKFFVVKNLRDELKMEFLENIWNLYELEELETIFEYQTGSILKKISLKKEETYSIEEYNDMEIEKDEEISELEDKIEELETEIKNLIKNLKNVNK